MITSFWAPPIAPAKLVGQGGLLLAQKSDGVSDGVSTIQGARTFDSQAGVWNTPDPYRGDVHDPMSQMAYMWDRNNPYTYSDPSGFSNCYTLVCSTDGGESARPDDVAYSPSAILTASDALQVIENLINNLNRGTNPADGKTYLEQLKNAINYNLKNNNDGAFTVDFKEGQPSPTLVSRNGVLKIYVSGKNEYWDSRYRNSIRVDVKFGPQRFDEYRYFNDRGLLWRGNKNINLPSVPFGLPRSGTAQDD